ncbi:glutamate-1-semialdehyde 2,1-aminomutase, chloroplastic-like [Humulus lupulus]|uniref:glutamate-1-semialdehyde 2,1-aminomutase, chloroplastic-like n=1 Tax=Humulus lupulus TaxID=3486 RepID=UPI002B404F7F|nr:glutamate-1-semialdehyde 2,1-aminomutase, chloroplastic-like [Humulus lupulus]
MAVSLDEKKNFTLKKSEEAFTAAKELMSGGVNSPVRAFKSVGGQPIVIDSVKGSHMRDIDGNEYIDYVGSWGPAIIGNADDENNIFTARSTSIREKIYVHKFMDSIQEMEVTLGKAIRLGRYSICKAVLYPPWKALGA